MARRFKEHAPTVEQSRAFLADDRNWLLAAVDDEGRPVGFLLAYLMARWDGRSMVFLYELDVAPEARRQGHGRALVDEAVRLAAASGAYKMWVETDEDNEPAKRTYSAGGGSRAGDNILFGWRFNGPSS
jgi:ribosomal protein S18 acetylase RimI-like enzyme